MKVSEVFRKKVWGLVRGKSKAYSHGEVVTVVVEYMTGVTLNRFAPLRLTSPTFFIKALLLCFFMLEEILFMPQVYRGKNLWKIGSKLAETISNSHRV